MKGHRIWKKWTRGALVLWGSFTLVFLIFTSVPDPARQLAGQQADPEVIADLRARFGLDQTPWVRYVHAVQALSPLGTLEDGGWGVRWPSLPELCASRIGWKSADAGIACNGPAGYNGTHFRYRCGSAHGAGRSAKPRRVV